jgi:hypothetical protein
MGCKVLQGWSSIERRNKMARISWAIALVCAVLADASGALSSKERAPHRSYGTAAEIQKCVADMQASLRGNSILGSRDTAAYIQHRGYLESRMGVTEYDVMVNRCRTMISQRRSGRQP